jgi:hypothetical protein
MENHTATSGQEILPPATNVPTILPTSSHLPALIVAAGPADGFAWDEFFAGQLRNRHTRAAYLLAVRRFLAWAGQRAPASLDQITPGMVGGYLDQHPGSLPTKKLHLAAIRAFFNDPHHRLARRHAPRPARLRPA